MTKAEATRALQLYVRDKITAYIYYIPETKELHVSSFNINVVRCILGGNIQLRYIVYSTPILRRMPLAQRQIYRRQRVWN